MLRGRFLQLTELKVFIISRVRAISVLLVLELVSSAELNLAAVDEDEVGDGVANVVDDLVRLDELGVEGRAEAHHEVLARVHVRLIVVEEVLELIDEFSKCCVGKFALKSWSQTLEVVVRREGGVGGQANRVLDVNDALVEDFVHCGCSFARMFFVRLCKLRQENLHVIHFVKDTSFDVLEWLVRGDLVSEESPSQHGGEDDDGHHYHSTHTSGIDGAFSLVSR